MRNPNHIYLNILISIKEIRKHIFTSARFMKLSMNYLKQKNAIIDAFKLGQEISNIGSFCPDYKGD